MLERLKLSEFKKNVAVIFSGSVFSQLILVASTPWLSRLYSPEQYGIFGLFVAISAVTGAIVTLRYGYAVQIAEKDEDAHILLQFCKYCAVFLSVVLLSVVIVGFDYFVKALHIEELGYFLYLLPLATLIAGLIEVYSIWLNRNKSFKYLSYSRVLMSAITVGFTILWAYLVDDTFRGLLLGWFLAQSVCLAVLYHEGSKYKQGKQPFNLKASVFRSVLYRYRGFPLYSLPSDIINVCTQQFPLFILNRFATSSEVGYFNMSNRILGLPSVFISNSVGEVFRQRAATDYLETGTCRLIFLKTFKTLFLFGIIPFLIIALFGPRLFTFILGDRWSVSGEYARLLSLMYFLRFCINPVTYVFFIAEKQKANFWGQILMFLSTIIPFALGFIFFESILISLLMYSLTYSAVYLYYFYFSYKFSINNKLTSKNSVAG